MQAGRKNPDETDLIACWIASGEVLLPPDHDAGSFEAEGRIIVFKIDDYERSANALSSESTGLTDRVRIITVMLAEEN
jgi:hypothetical protein